MINIPRCSTELEPCTRDEWYLKDWGENYKYHIPSYITSYGVPWLGRGETVYRHSNLVNKFNMEL
jgi:hypothetical protein